MMGKFTELRILKPLLDYPFNLMFRLMQIIMMGKPALISMADWI